MSVRKDRPKAEAGQAPARGAWQRAWKYREPVLWALVLVLVATVRWPFFEGW